MKNYIVIYISLQTPYLAKFWFSSYMDKMPLVSQIVLYSLSLIPEES